jgi:replicative DNA helicase
MKGLLRSVIDVDGGVSQENLIGNFQKLIAAHVEWTQPADQRIYDFILNFFQQRLEIPARQTISDYFETRRDAEVTERLKDFDGAKPYIRTNYSHLLSSTVEEQNKIKAITLLKEAQEIIAKGLVIDKEKKQGLREGVLHFSQNAHKLLVYQHNTRLQGNLREDGQDVWDQYQEAKANKGLAWGKFCGLNDIDKIIRGVKKGELWLHAAFTGELKTTFALNWAYNLVTRYRSNVYYITLEMPYEQLRQMIYALHSANPRFKALGYDPLEYDKICAGTLTAAEEQFYKIVIDDFVNNPEYGSFDVWSPDDDVTPDDIKMQAELAHQKNEIHLLIIDHGGLVEPRRKKRGKDYTIELNSVIRDSKKLALHFNHGEKVAVLLLFQINRDGKDYADKSEGRYKLRALSYANEAERSADVVTTTYLNDEHRTAGTTLFDCLKRRDGQFFAPFVAGVDWKTRSIYNRDQFAGTSSDKGMSLEDHRNVAHSIEKSVEGMFSV